MFKNNLLQKNDYLIENDLDEMNYIIPIDLKRTIIKKVENEIKCSVNIFYNRKNKTIRLWTLNNLNGKKNEEIINVKNLTNYLNQNNYSFLIMSERGEFEQAYFSLKKIQMIICSLKESVKTKNYLNKEYLISYLNEIVFLKDHGLLLESGLVYDNTLDLLKEKSLPRWNSTNLTNQAFLDVIKLRLEKLKLKLRVLLSYCLSCSEEMNHVKAISLSEKAVKVIIGIFICTMIVGRFYLYKSLAEEAKNQDFKNNVKKSKKINYILNFLSILDSLIGTIENFKFINIKNMSIYEYIEQYDILLKKDFPFVNLKTTPDLGIINNFDIIKNSYLNESTILTLSNLNYFNFEDTFVSKNLENEIEEISLLEKISFLILSFYILATEHRFIEHSEKSKNPFYKYLLNYFIDSNKNAVKNNSEIFLTKAVEICYLFAPDCFPLVSQILSVYKKFELNRPKIIKEFVEEPTQFIFLKPLKNGFKTNMIIPIIQNFQKKNKKKNFQVFMNESENVPTQENINEIDNKENCTKIINQIKVDHNTDKDKKELEKKEDNNILENLKKNIPTDIIKDIQENEKKNEYNQIRKNISNGDVSDKNHLNITPNNFCKNTKEESELENIKIDNFLSEIAVKKIEIKEIKSDTVLKDKTNYINNRLTSPQNKDKIKNTVIKKSTKNSDKKKEKKKNVSLQKVSYTKKKKVFSQKPLKKSKSRVNSSEKYVRNSLKTKSSYITSKLAKLKFNQRIKKINLSQTLDNFLKNKKKTQTDLKENANTQNNFFLKKYKQKVSKPIDKIVSKIKDMKMKQKMSQSPPQKLCFDLIKKKEIFQKKENLKVNQNENLLSQNKTSSINYNNINNFNFIINSYTNGQQLSNTILSNKNSNKNSNFKIH